MRRVVLLFGLFIAGCGVAPKEAQVSLASVATPVVLQRSEFVNGTIQISFTPHAQTATYEYFQTWPSNSTPNDYEITRTGISDKGYNAFWYNLVTEVDPVTQKPTHIVEGCQIYSLSSGMMYFGVNGASDPKDSQNCPTQMDWSKAFKQMM